MPLDISLGGTFQTLLVTGPNTGGKTVALKATGIFALMAQTGMFIPALSAELPIFHAIYADIGDEQSIEQSLSTFSGHMTNLVSILRDVRPGTSSWWTKSVPVRTRTRAPRWPWRSSII